MGGRRVQQPASTKAPQKAACRAPSASVAADAEMADDEAQAPVGFDDLVSGRFDDEADSESQLPTKRVLQPQPEQPKLHKVLAQAGLGSRLEMEQLILEGRISVNNQPAHIGQRIQFGDTVKINGRQTASCTMRAMAGMIVESETEEDRKSVV